MTLVKGSNIHQNKSIKMGRTFYSYGRTEPNKRVLVAVVEGRRQRGIPKLRWEDGVTEDARKLGGEKL